MAHGPEDLCFLNLYQVYLSKQTTNGCIFGSDCTTHIREREKFDITGSKDDHTSKLDTRLQNTSNRDMDGHKQANDVNPQTIKRS